MHRCWPSEWTRSCLPATRAPLTPHLALEQPSRNTTQQWLYAPVFVSGPQRNSYYHACYAHDAVPPTHASAAAITPLHPRNGPHASQYRPYGSMGLTVAPAAGPSLDQPSSWMFARSPPSSMSRLQKTSWWWSLQKWKRPSTPATLTLRRFPRRWHCSEVQLK